ncbi:uncharacterized protein LOC110967779 [Acanthochromis polyacanthus]|uniref:uncharacterized protein LOC110967779 n=1 Tax=Acanthochromis polyacanthus TaxID=80966 RepID=UPI002233FB3F|nr:uncharacterized protein LOC110967779 [Acanthochromis polyacanthus]
MDSVDICAATSTGDNKRRPKKNRYWRKRLHLRKAAAQPPAMQRADKRGPKKTPAAWKQSTAWPSSQKPPQEAQQSHRRTNDSRNTLRFTCSQCKDNLEYVPKDLVRHFEEKHRGNPPVFSCHMCTFSTHEFSYLQVHLLSHKDTFSSCCICNDNVQRTWAEFSAHLTLCHCPNGKYSCEVCQKFSTGDATVFLEHVYAHNLDLEGAEDVDLSLHTKDKNQLSTTQIFRCQHCSYEASHEWLITKHIKAVHTCQNSNLRRKKKEVHSVEMKPSDTIPKMKPRLTRSAVREMCWLTQDCLSLPGREFLDKYCHLSDPQTTLEETQQFLMKSVTGETGDQKWTKALKTVLSNVPQDMNLHPKVENGIVSNSSDLTVLTVKNKITVAQNGAAYAKRLKMMSDKDAVSPDSAADDAQCAVDQNGCQSNLNDHASCPQAENKLHNDVSLSVHSEPCTQMQENRENQELKTHLEIVENGKKLEGPMQGDGILTSSDLKLTNESAEQTSVHKALPKVKRRKRRRKRRTRFKKGDKKSPALPLKIVLKKNPVKEKQWVSQSSLSPSEGGSVDGHCGLSNPHTATEGLVQILPNEQPPEVHQKKWTKGSKSDLLDSSEAVNSILQLKPGEELTPSCAADLTGSENMTTNRPAVLEGLLSTCQTQEDKEKLLQLLQSEVDKSTSQANLRAASVTEEVYPKKVQLQTSHSGTDCHVSDKKNSSPAHEVTPHSSSMSSPFSQRVIAPQGEVNMEDSCLALSAEQSNQSVEGMPDREVPPDSCPDLLSSISLPPGKAIQQEPSPASGLRWQPVPKDLERTLKLVAINPSQLVKRPAGDQPVVVLNHPDADIPEVAKIMEVVNRYRGEVRKVVLSRRTLNALSALNREASRTNDPEDAQAEISWQSKSSVQERFALKFKFRRLTRKKYEVVGAVSPSRDVELKLRCWFCGRAFTSQQMWMAHRQRHLMEWKRPNCENLNVAHTG